MSNISKRFFILFGVCGALQVKSIQLINIRIIFHWLFVKFWDPGCVICWIGIFNQDATLLKLTIWGRDSGALIIFKSICQILKETLRTAANTHQVLIYAMAISLLLHLTTWPISPYSLVRRPLLSYCTLFLAHSNTALHLATSSEILLQRRLRDSNPPSLDLLLHSFDKKDFFGGFYAF